MSKLDHFDFKSHNMAMRRSARETKKPEFYVGSQESFGKSAQSEYDEENRQSNKVSSDSEDPHPKRRKRDEAPPKEGNKIKKPATASSQGQQSTLFVMLIYL